MSDASVLKLCSRCSEEKPVTEFGICRKTKDGHDCYCKPCRAANSREWRAERAKKFPAPTVAAKVCRRCHEEKPAAEFPTSISGVGGLASYCKPCDRAYHNERTAKLRQKPRTKPAFTEKYCPRCEQTKPVSEFYTNVCSANGYTVECRKCQATRRKAALEKRREESPAQLKRDFRSAYLKSMYGITFAEYEFLHDKQRGLCAICQQPETTIRKGKLITLSVDHPHDDGPKRIRELLCRRCNNAIGAFRDSPALLEAAAAYLRKHGAT